MKAVFKPKEFRLCKLPLPKGYPYSQTHAGVAFKDNRVYLTSSPYPSVKYKKIITYARVVLRKLTKGLYPPLWGDLLENPMLYLGTHSEHAPVNFEPYLGNPLVNTPPKLFGLPSFNSDPDILIQDEKLYVINREIIRVKKNVDNSFIFHVRLGLLEFQLINHYPIYNSFTYVIEGNENICSPAIRYINKKYRIFYLDTSSYNTGSSCCELYMRSDTNVKGQYKEKRKLILESGDFTPWHLSVFDYKGQNYAIVACIKNGIKQRCYQMLGEFDSDLTILKIYQRPLVDIPSYRGAAYVDDNGMFILYSTTVHYKLTGSKSVDGRDVFMIQKDFNELLIDLKNG